jgi:hypothetical protein
MPKTMTMVRAALAVVLVAASAVAFYVGVGLVQHSLRHGQVGYLADGLGFFVAGAAALGVVGWLCWLLLEPEQPKTKDRLINGLVIAAYVAGFGAEIGLAWLATEFAAAHHAESALTAGGLALVGLGAFAVFGSSVEPTLIRIVELSTIIIVSEASLGLLAIMLAWEGQRYWALLPIGFGLAVLLPWLIVATAGRRDWLRTSFVAIVPVASLGSLAVGLVAYGHDVAAIVTGALAIVSPVPLLRRRGPSPAAPTRDWVSMARDFSPWPGAKVSVIARLAGLAVPLATLVWAAASHVHGHGSAAVASMLVAAGWFSAAAVALLLLEEVVLGWLRPGTLPLAIERAAEGAQVEAASYLDIQSQFMPPEAARSDEAGRWWSVDPLSGSRDDRDHLERDRYERDRYERERYERERSQRERYARDPAEQRRYEQERYEWERRERERGRERYEWERERGVQDRRERQRNDLMLAHSVLDGLARPLGPSLRASLTSLTLAQTTGLNVNRIWPRLELVVPRDVKVAVIRQEKTIAALRVVAASAVCTALVWPLTLALLTSQSTAGALALLALAPLAVAVAATLIARNRVADSYARRVDATEMYRFDLAKALHLPLLRNNAAFAALRKFIYADWSATDRPIVWSETQQPSPGPDLGGLRETLAAEVSRLAANEIQGILQQGRELLHDDIRELLREQHDRLRGWLSTDALGPEELAALAEQIAAHAAGPVSTDLNRQMSELQSEFAQRLHATMKEVVSESVLGPPLANFTGYLAIELDRSSEEDPHVGSADGLLMAGPGHELKLVMSVVRDARAAAVSALDAGPDGSFFVLEPVVIEGGREAGAVEFDAVADCGTLTPLPRRRSLRVIDDAQASFGFKLPDHAGRHELWFQLYQAGRLLQVIAVAVEVRTDRVAT